MKICAGSRAPCFIAAFLAAFRGIVLQVEEPQLLPEQRFIVNLSEPSFAPQDALTIFDRDPDRHPTLRRIADGLCVSKRTAHVALLLGKRMQQAGINDPFVRLTEAPAAARRYRHAHNQTAPPPSSTQNTSSLNQAGRILFLKAFRDREMWVHRFV